MALRIYNSMSRRLEDFRPLDDTHIKMYVCGPTVYDRIHLGNARPIVIFDMLYRLLRFSYPQVTYVRNITDVDDKINQRAFERNIEISVLTRETTAQFHTDIACLGVLTPDLEPRATDHIPQMCDMIAQLIARGHAYESAGHVLFDVPTLPSYGQLSGFSQEDMIAGARVEIATYKKNPHDFVLWKPSEPGMPRWDSPWGAGRPGWHIECSAMSQAYLGDCFDIHGGGRDLIFPHHENERAQTLGCADHAEFAQYWMHNEMLLVEGEKMSKSGNNFVTLQAALAQYPGEVVRLMLLSTHYRKVLNWTQEALENAKKTLDKFYTACGEYDETAASVDPQVILALESDLNTPLALAHLHALAGDIHKEKDFVQKRVLQQSLQASGRFMGILGQPSDTWFQGSTERTKLDPQEILETIARRAQAKSQRDFQTADAIRNQLSAQGVTLSDTPDGATTWRWT